MKIKDIMTRGIQTILSSATVKDAAQLMQKYDIGALPVEGKNNLAGMLTDRDIVVRAVAEGLDPNKIMVEDIMTSDVLACSDSDDVSDVVQLMESRKVRRVVVLNQSRQPIGVVSLGDIAAHAGVALAGEALKKVSEPVHSV